MSFGRRATLLAFVAAAGTLVLSAGACLKTRGPSIALDAPAPEFKLKSNDNRDVELKRLTADGPAVVVFYRGFW